MRAACARHGIIAGIHTAGGAQSREFADAGFAMCTVTTDVALLRAAALRELTAARAQS